MIFLFVLTKLGKIGEIRQSILMFILCNMLLCDGYRGSKKTSAAGTSLETRSVHSCPLPFFVAAKLVRDRNAGFAEAGITVRHVLCGEADAGTDLSCLKDIVAVECEDGLAAGETVAQSGIHITRCGQIVDALRGFAAHHSGQGQLQVRLLREGDAVGQHGNAVTDTPVEGEVPEIIVFLPMPHSDQRKPRVQPVLYAERDGRLYSYLLLEVEVKVFVDLHQPLLRLVEGLGRAVLDVREPCAEDIPALQDVGQLELILLCGFQRGIPTDFRISAAQVGDGILHCPIVGVFLVAAQGKLPDPSGGGSITKVEGRIDIPLVPCRRAVMFCGKRSVQRELVTETLAESGIEIQGLLAAARLHIVGNCGAVHGGGACVVIELVAMVDACGADCAVVHLPAASQVVLLGKEELPAVDALAIFGAESKFLALQDAVQLLAGGYLPGKKAVRYDYTLNMSLSETYRLTMEPVDRLILKQMGGILATSLVILLILGFTFGYLVRTILRQKTLEEMKSDFTNNITHELKTPIAVAYAANDALLHFGLAEDRQQREKYLGICLKTLFPTLIEQHRLKAEKPVEVTLDIEPEELVLTADRIHLSNILSNLMDNAIKYSPEKAEIGIRCRKTESGQVEIAVSDHGTGIPADKLPHVFDKFYRVPTGNVHNTKGYGLGLFYVKTMTEKHNGNVSVKSEPGKGSTFTIRI